ncbi:hypothetical protein CCR75_009230 [Bremia lactucae]|uniref:Uncharacterized protein n=1 Tax=Bremia lactucae TaxID=4779 RepID=A0A976FN65_BRELC|nr:hypothetical protein CCR75_009230 [Bremia lactucae]
MGGMTRIKNEADVDLSNGDRFLPPSRDKSSGMKTKREAHAINRLSAAQPLLFAQQVRQITLYKGEPRSKQRLEC